MMTEFNMKNNKNKDGQKKVRAKGYDKRRRMRIISIALVCFVLIAGVSLTVYSKYYKTGYNKGMATASGFYFDSNYMKETDLSTINNIEELMADDELLKVVPVSGNPTAWSERSYPFTVEVRNYTNQILYNDKDLNISYTVELVLLDAPQGATYQIKKSTDDTYITLGTGSSGIVSYQDLLQGGRLNWDSYELLVTLTGTEEQYQKSRILVLAYPTAPSFLIDTKKIAGIITAEYNQKEMEITEQKFTIVDTPEFNADWNKAVKAESAYIYQIKTTGNYSGNSGGAMQKIKIKWDKDKIEFNPNDKYLVEQGLPYNPDMDQIIIETMPYASLKFIFYKKPNFETWISSASENEYKTLVSAEMVD